jgi:FemAB family.
VINLYEKVVTEEKKWTELISKFKYKDIYFTYNYFKTFSNNGDGEPTLYYFECEDGCVAYPFMLREINTHTNDFDKHLYDISSVYGYGGPLYKVNSNLESLLSKFQSHFDNYCLRRNIISQFDRFHPLLENQNFFMDYEDIIYNRKTITMDLSETKIVWENIHPKCKNMIRKAFKNNVVCIINDRKETINDFIEIYHQSMKNKNANDYYFFDKKFFEESQKLLNSELMICNAYVDDIVICSILILVSDRYLHYYLSGTKHEYRNYQPNSALLYEIAKWGSENGKEVFHLGGGVSSEEDSLYKFKKSFNRQNNGERNFYIGKKIHNPHIYNQLCLLNGKKIESEFFPAYRK